MFIAGFVVNP